MKEMKLYAIRNKETGKIVNDNYGHPHVRRYPEDVFDSRRDELVTLRIEPSEPCVSCDEFAMIVLNTRLPHERWNFCPMCGRSLK